MAGKKKGTPKKAARKTAPKQEAKEAEQEGAPPSAPPPLRALRAMPRESVELLADREKLAKVRYERWLALRDEFPPVNPAMADWAERMEAHYGPQVKIHENIVDWITAFYVARYGENEAYWPEELDDNEVRRALAWEKGSVPLGVRLLGE